MAEFKLGRLRFVWQGAWTTGTAYVKDDIIRYGGTSYVCVQAHSANIDFYVDRDAGRWEVMTAGIQYKSAEWSTGIVYAENDIVRYGGRVYICLDGHTSGEDFFNDKDSNKWNLFVDGVQWKVVPWTASGTLYKEGDLVRHGGRVYICVDGHLSSPLFETDFNAGDWQLFADGTQWANTWTAGDLYKVGDIVRVSGKTYVCVNEHTANSTERGGFYSDSANWNLYTDGVSYRGVWDTDAYYWVGDVVRYGAKSFICIAGHEASADFYDDEPISWNLLTDGQQWVALWVKDTWYKEGDIVSHGGTTYICINGHTSIDATDETGFDVDLANNNWEIFATGYNWKNEWTTETYYKVNDIVRYGAKAYVCVTSHTSSALFDTDWDATGIWELLVDGQQWKTSPWQSGGTLYKEGDIVRYGGRTYICINGHTSTASANRFDLDFNAGIWQLFADGTQWKTATWTAGTYYKTGDIVRYGGKTYIAVNDHEANTTQDGGFYTDLTASKWNLYTDGTEWKGNWALNTYYKLGDIVRYDGNTYICNTPHTSADTVEEGLEADLVSGFEKWTTYSEGFKFKGNWSAAVEEDLLADPPVTAVPGTKYNINDVVKFGGSLYICIAYHVSETSFNELYWTVLVGGLEFEDTWDAAVEYQIGDIVTYGGYSYVAQERNTGVIPTGFGTEWNRLTTGFKVAGNWSSTQSYKVGELVKYGGSSYVAVVDTSPGQKPRNTDGSISVLWEIVAPGFNWRGTWAAWDVEPDLLADPVVLGVPRTYRVGDTIRWVSNSYVCILDHTAIDAGINQPDNDVEGIYWQSIAEGAEGNVLTRRGDLITRDATQNKRLPRGLPGQTLQVSGKDIVWDYFNIVDNVYYVTIDGIDSPERGTTLQTPFRTIKYATEYILENEAERAPATIYVKTGLYNEELPIVVPANVAIVGDELRSVRVQPAAGYGVSAVQVASKGSGFSTPPTVTFSPPTLAGGVAAEGVAVLGSGADTGKVVAITVTKAGSGYTSAPIVTITNSGTSSATATATLKAKLYTQTNMFYLRDATGLRNMTLLGLDVTLSAPNQYYTKRPATDAYYVSLDPGTGPGDESTWITTRSPYVQNVTTYGSGAVGMKIDGALHNGGYKTMVCNDYTQVISDGIGIWATNQGRVEAVSVFTYYSHLGYLAEDGGVIRGTNGNCSYGTFGVSAEGVDPSEISRISRVNNRKEEATIINTFTDGEGIVHLEYSNAGENYQSSNTTFTFEGNGVANSILINQVVVQNGGVKEVRVLDAGKDWLAVVNNAQDGTSTAIRISASDVQVTDAYKGERIVIIDGQGVGQYGYVTYFNGGTKIATIAKESFTPLIITATNGINNRLTTSSTETLTVGMAVGFDFTPTSITASATETGTNTITVSNSNKLAVGMPIEFSGTTFGNIIAGTTYYVSSIVDKTHIKISASNGGSDFSLISETGNMAATAGGLFGGANLKNEGSIYYVRELLAGGTQFTISTSIGGSEVNLTTAIGSINLYAAGFESFYSQPIEAVLDTTTRYTIEPRVVFSTGKDAAATSEISKGLDEITTSSNGGYFQTNPSVIISGTELDAQGATATAAISGSVDRVVIREGGSGFIGNPSVAFVGGGLEAGSPNHAQATANVTGKITSVSVTNGGTGYTNPPMVTIEGENYNNDGYISAKITKVVGEIIISNSGSAYTSVPNVTITGGGGTGATAVANLSAVVTGFEIIDGGSGYTAGTTQIIVVPAPGDTTGDGATVTFEIDNGEEPTENSRGAITSINLNTSGSGYTKPPVVVITSTGAGTGAEAIPTINGSVLSVTVINGGSGYTSVPSVEIDGSATAYATVTGAVNELTIVNGGTGFSDTATINFTPVPDFIYDENKCSRDVGLLVEAVTADIIFNTNVQSVIAGLAYLRSYTSEVLANQRTQTVAAINHVRDLTVLETIDATAKTRIATNFGIITNIISSGLSAVPALTFTEPANVDQHRIDAAEVLRLNRAFIQNEVTAWIDNEILTAQAPFVSFSYDSATCARDIGYLVDALVYDLLYGGNSLSKEIGNAYYEGTNGVIPGQQQQTIAALNYLKSIVDNIIVEDTTWGQIGDGVQIVPSLTADSTDGTAAQALLDDIIDIVTDGTFSGTSVPPTWINGDLNNTIRTTINSAIPTIQTDTIAWINAKYVGAGATAIATVSRVVESVTIVNPGIGYTSVPTVSITGGFGSGALGTVLLNAAVTGVTVTAPGKNYTTTPTVSFAGGKNFKSIVAGEAYYKNASSAIAISGLQITETLAALEYITDLALAISTNTNPQYEYQSILNRSGSITAPAGAYEQSVFWTDVVKAIAENGTNPIAASIIELNKTFILTDLSAYADINSGSIVYTDADLRKRIMLLVDAYIYDLIHSTAERTVSIGQQYFDVVAGESEFSYSIVNYLGNVLQSIVRNTTVVPQDDGVTTWRGTWASSTSYQVDDVVVFSGKTYIALVAHTSSSQFSMDAVNSKWVEYANGQVYAELIAGEISSVSAVNNLTNLVLSINTLSGVLGNTNNDSYTNLLIENKPWIQAEVIEYIKSNFVYFDYDQTKCERDTGLILDAVGMDVALGTNFNSVTAGLAYQRANAETVKANQIAKTIAAIEGARDQVLSLSGVSADATATSRVASRFNEIVNILRYGPTSASALTFPAPTGVDQDLIDAKDQLQANRTFLRAEVIAWIAETYPDLVYDDARCSRDVGYIVDALSYDILYGGNSAISTVSKSYFVGALSQLGAGEATATIAAYQHLQSVSAQVSRGTPVTPSTGNTESQDFSSGNTSMLVATELGNLLQIVINVITDGDLTSLPIVSEPSVTWADDALETAKSAIASARVTIIAATINSINIAEFDYNEALCARDVGLIIDAIAHDVRYSQSAIPTATAATVNVLSNIVVTNNGEGYGSGTSVSFTDLAGGTLPAASPIITNGEITGFTITNPGKGFTSAPTVTINASAGSGAFARASVLGSVVQQIRIIHPGSGYTHPPYVKLVDPNNTNEGRFEVRIGDGVLDQPTFIARGTAYLAAGTTVSSPTGYADTYQVGEFVYVQNLTNIPTPGANIQFEGNNQFYKLVTIRALEGAVGLTGGRSLITANRAFVQQQVIAYINGEYTNLDYNESLCFRDVGLIIDAIVADIFGDTERGIEAGKAYFRSASSLAAIENPETPNTQGFATLDAINKIEEYLTAIVQNIDVERNQLYELQVKEPGISGGSAAIAPMKNTLDIIRDIIVNGSDIYEVQDLLLDNKPYIQAEVMAFINTTYPDFTYNETLCNRDVGLIVDAVAYDLFAGFGASGTAPFSGLARSREAGLRYYSNASAQIAITTQQAETVAAIQRIAEVAIAVINNLNPSVVYQSTVARIARSVNASATLEDRIQDGIDEIVNIIENGVGVLPVGTYSARLQVSPPFTVDNVPAHDAAVTIRSKYSQVRLTNHDFLNVGTGNKAETNYPGVPVNAPEPENEVLEAGGGRCFYTSTDQDGNFRVGELFAVEQATGIATLNADAFNLSGLNELTLGGINIGGTGATITEFSTDSIFFANSDSIVPTQKAIKTYIASQLGSGGGNLAVNAITAGDVAITGNEISTNFPDGLDLIVPSGIYITETVASTSPTTGSLVIDGGVGIANDVNIGGDTNVGGDLTITGNLTVNGDLTTLSVGGVSIEDINITIAKDAINAAAANGAGITVNGPAEVATITYASADDSWNLNKAVKADSIQGTPIGNTTRSTAAFTTLAANDVVSFTDDTSSTSSGNGAVVVSGGVGIGENLNVGGTIGTVGFSASGNVTLSPTGASVQVNPAGTGGVVISPTGSGGLAINPTAVGTIDNVNIGNTTRGTGKFTTLAANGVVTITDATASTSVDSGALQVDGGVGINGTLYAGSIQNTPIGSTTANTGKFTTLQTTDTTASTSTSTGSVKIAGGLGVAGAIWAGSINVGGGGIDNTPIGDTTRSTGKFTTLAANSAVTFTGGTTSTSSTTGQLVVTGGVGISENVYVGGNTVITGNLTVNGTTTTVNSTELSVDDVNITLGDTASPTDTTANGGGLTLRGTSNKTMTWVQSTGYWTFNQPIQASSVQNTPVGSTTANTGAFTSLTANAAVTFTQNTASTSTSTGTLVVTGGLGVSGRINAGDFTGTIGANTRNAGSFTSLDANSTVGLSPANASVTISPSGSGTVTLNPATAGTINNMSIGATTHSTGRFTTLTVTSTFSMTDTTQSTTTGTGALVVAGGVGVAKNLNVGGTLSAVSKSFLIDHPTRDGYKLQYGSLEGPENGVYVRGKISNGNVIELPDYWTGLVDEATITVNLTAIGSAQALYVEKIEGNKVYVGGGDNFFYTVYAERKDIDDLIVEYKA